MESGSAVDAGHLQSNHQRASLRAMKHPNQNLVHAISVVEGEVNLVFDLSLILNLEEELVLEEAEAGQPLHVFLVDNTSKKNLYLYQVLN